MKRVLHVVDRAGGGVPVAARTYITNTSDNFEHHVIVPFQDSSPPPVWADVDACFHDLGSGQVHRWRAIRSVVRRHDIDVVHAHSSFSGVYARTALSKRRVRLVYTPHCYAFERQDISRISRMFFHLAETMLAWNTTVVAACSPGEVLVASSMRGLRGNSILVPNVASVAAAPSHAPAAALQRVGMVGRVSKQKGVDHFIDAMRAIRTVIPDARGVWIGGGDEKMTRRLIECGIEVTGWVSAAAVAAALDGLDLYVHSAAWEGFPISLLDAHQRGLPIVVRPINAFPDVPREFTTAVLGDNPDQFPRSSEELLDWQQRNRDFWNEYLIENISPKQRHSLSQAWSDEGDELTGFTNPGGN